jgi:ribosomal protein S18 acetylase RimI-like enzyme
MTVQFKPIESLAEARVLAPAWTELAGQAGSGALFRGPEWLLPWWHAYHRVLAADLFVLAGYAGEKLVCLAPFYIRLARAAGLRLREIRLLGDAGPRPPALDILCQPEFEERAGVALARAVIDYGGEWDLLDLQPLRDPSRVRAFFASRLNSLGHQIESNESGGARRVALTAAAGIDAAAEPHDVLATAYVGDVALLRKGLAALRRLSRLEWAVREESSPLADAEATQLLEEVTLGLAVAGRARLARLDDSAQEAVAAALVVDDGDRAVVLAMAADPEHPGAAERLLTAEARAAAERGCIALDVVTGAGDYSVPTLPSSRQRAIRLRAYGGSPAAALARTYSSVNRRLQAAIGAPSAAAAGARAAWSKIRTAAAHVAGFERLQLYRGELWTRGTATPTGLTLQTLSEAEFDALVDTEREEVIESLELDVEYCRKKWRRGDLTIFARWSKRSGGIAWCAFGSVYVPELERTLGLEPFEAYIHDVFVAPQARGRAVAPSMLEFLAGELRQRDFYRSWALIGSDNVASLRAFEKASYTAVCDVIYARMGAVDRVTVRPPDPEAKKLLGLA